MSILFTNPLPLSLYIHFPWCVQKCPYCDFNSYNQPEHIPEKAYINALIEDFQRSYTRYGFNRPIQSIFMGGGTPSLFSGDAISILLHEINSLAEFTDSIEITLEANPGAIDQHHFDGYIKAGVNRLSIGAQSFNPELLKKLGRIHQADEIEKAVVTARTAGFNNINLDIMYALPNQTTQQAKTDLEKALLLNPNHLSWYHLTIEPNTVFYRSPPSIPDDDLVVDIEEMGHSLLTDHNYRRYEISAYAKDNDVSVHNTNYWQFGDYLGIGAGAHSKVTDINKAEVKRFWQYRTPRKYLDTALNFTAKEQTLNKENLLFEFMLNAMRLSDGTLIEIFSKHTGLTLSDFGERLKAAKEKGLLEITPTHLKPTPLGFRFLNELLWIFSEKY